MSYSIYEILVIIFWVMSGIALICAVITFFKFNIAHVLAVLSGHQAKRQIARWRTNIVAETITEEATSVLHDDEEATSVLYDDEEATSLLGENAQEEIGTEVLRNSNDPIIEEKRMIHSAYIISLSGEAEAVEDL